MFPELRTSVSPDEREHLVLRLWKDNDIFKRSIEERDLEKIFAFNEGPPTVNGVPGIHHVFSRTLKDVVCRYKTMQGYRVARKAGWDTHGLPVELAIEKQLGFRHKDQIKEYGVEKFNQLCRETVYDHIQRDGGWNELTERMAYWVDLEKPYITCTNDYIESVWWSLKQFFEAGLLYKGYKIQPYCPRCETSLSSHEVSLGYDTAKDPSVFVKFKRKNVEEDEYFLAWTTTPWTLISNLALAVHPDVDYVTVRNTRKDKTEILTLADALVTKLEGDVEVLRKFKGRELEYAEYERLFDYIPVDQKAFFVVLGEHVTTEDGTGIVHTAPAFGEEDFQVSKKYGLPIINPVDKSGCFVPEVTDFAGEFVKTADSAIIDNLKKRGLLYRKETIEHTYPFCWRCDTPLLYYARTSWYIRVTDYKQQMIELNKTINWHPEEIGEGRFGNWLEELKDWGLSRERFWGTPLPIWECTDCGKQKCVGSYEELRESTNEAENGKTVAELLDSDTFDPHKPHVDRYTFACSCGGTMRRSPDVIDVWYDSGSMPFAQFHYPFENQDLFERCYPADYISEGIDQTRGWFYTMHAINSFLFKKPAYKNVIVNDLVLDKNGQKMSKSRGNVVNPFEVINKLGADATRWYFVASSVPWRPKLFSIDDIAEVERKVFGTLINTYGFFALYANIDHFEYNADKKIPELDRPEVDRWILSKLNSLIAECESGLNEYDLTRPARAIQDFVIEQLSNWYVRRNRRRFWKGERGTDKQAAYETLYECLSTIVRLMAPFAPFISDWIYRAMQSTTAAKEIGSVHLELYPKANAAVIDENLEKRMQSAQVISSLTRQMRERAKIRVRQPLERILIPVANRWEIEQLRKVEDVVREEVNVKRIEYVEAGDSDVIKLKAKANFKLLGARLGKNMKSVAQLVQNMSQEEIRSFQQQGSIELRAGEENFVLTRGEIDVVAEDIEGWLVSSEGGLTVALDTHISEALEKEGLAREFINRIQNLRKESGFDVTDRIRIECSTSSDLLKDAVLIHSEYIREETLATSIEVLEDELDGSALEIEGETANVRVAQAS